MHDRAWSDIKIAILAKKPMLPMQIEQGVAAPSKKKTGLGAMRHTNC